MGIPSRDFFVVTEYLYRSSRSSDQHMKKLMSQSEGLHGTSSATCDSMLLIRSWLHEHQGGHSSWRTNDSGACLQSLDTGRAWSPKTTGKKLAGHSRSRGIVLVFSKREQLHWISSTNDEVSYGLAVEKAATSRRKTATTNLRGVSMPFCRRREVAQTVGGKDDEAQWVGWAPTYRGATRIRMEAFPEHAQGEAAGGYRTRSGQLIVLLGNIPALATHNLEMPKRRTEGRQVIHVY